MRPDTQHWWRSAGSVLLLASLASCQAGGTDDAGVAEAPGVTGDAILQPLTATMATAEAGRRVFVERSAGHCILCHRVDSLAAGFQGDIGPDLSDVGARLSAAQLRLRIVDPSVLNSATVMPAYFRRTGLNQVASGYLGKTVLSALQIEQLVAYLVTLKAGSGGGALR